MLAVAKNKYIGIDLDETIASVFEAVFSFTKEQHPSISHLGFDAIIQHDWWMIDALNLSKEETIRCWEQFDTTNPLDIKIIPILLSQE